MTKYTHKANKTAGPRPKRTGKRRIPMEKYIVFTEAYLTVEAKNRDCALKIAKTIPYERWEHDDEWNAQEKWD